MRTGAVAKAQGMRVIGLTGRGGGRLAGMAKKTQKLNPDTVLKNYWRSNERFADFFNAVLFEGEQLFRPEELEDADVEESSILEHGQYAEAIQASRDKIKIRKKSKAYGVEFRRIWKRRRFYVYFV